MKNLTIALWAYQSEVGENSFATRLMSEKDHIISNYFNNLLPQMFELRAKAAFGNEVTMNEIVNFMKGNKNNKGYIQKLQQMVDIHYSSSFRNASNIFKLKANEKIAELVSQGSCTINDIPHNQQRGLQKMMDAQQDILDAMSNLISMAKPYLLYMSAMTKQPLDTFENGFYDVSQYSGEMKTAVQMYNNIQAYANVLESSAVDLNNISHNFDFFKTTANKFHDVYGEYLLTLCAFKLNESHKEVMSQIVSSWTGTKVETWGSGNITISKTEIHDPQILNILNNSINTSNFGTFTATNDTTITSSINGVTGTYGGSVKEYSDRTVQRSGGWTSFTDFKNLETAATLATQYGLPAHAADQDFILNLGGALYGKYGNPSFLNTQWNDYIQLVTKLLTLDSIMGRMANLNIANNSNNLIIWKNGQIYFLGDLIQKLKPGNVNSTTGNRWWAANQGENGQWDRSFVEETHYEVWKAKESSSEARSQMLSKIHQINIKIHIDLNALLGL